MTGVAQQQPESLRYRGHVARLYLTPRQAAVLDGQGQTARAVWNLLHEWYTWAGPGGIAKRPSIAEIDLQLREARANPLPGWEWLALLPAQATQQVLRHYLRSWNRHFRGLAGPPRFKKRSSSPSVDNPQASRLRIIRLNRRWGEVTILMVGRVRFRWTRPLPGVSPRCPGRITGARLVKDSLGWHVSFRIEEPAVEVAANPGPPVGVDCGVVHSMALSTGEFIDMPRLLSHGEEQRLLGLERKAARQQLAFQRRLSREPASRSKRQRRTYQQIAGLRARQARRSIECARCRSVAPENRLDQANFRCVDCGHQANCDINAAQVLLERGLTARSGATPGCGGTAREARMLEPHREPSARHAEPTWVA